MKFLDKNGELISESEEDGVFHGQSFKYLAL
jgi:hypothetical protein